ncbi:MAG: cytochrome c [Calditerrivibrio sp.]|nr:cytochrome c [Calditerrivibrio sp.]
MKKIFLVALIAIIAVSVAFAAGDARKGKREWKGECRTVCHDGSKAGVPALSPTSKTQKQWDALKGKIDDCVKKNGKKANAENIFQYLRDHAMDSDQPETCG